MIADADLLNMIESGRLIVDLELGLVFSPKSNTPSVALGCLTKKGYVRAKLYVAGKSEGVFIHRIVCIAQHGLPPEPGMMPNHKNLVKHDNRGDNLEWLTSGQNTAHAGKAGRLGVARGERQGKAKLTAKQVIAMREKASIKPNYAELGREFGVSGTQAKLIIQRRAWQHI